MTVLFFLVKVLIAIVLILVFSATYTWLAIKMEGCLYNNKEAQR